MDDITPEELEAILGTDYETVLADILRQRERAEDRQMDQQPVGQLPSGRVFFDPGGVAQNLINQYKGKKDSAAAKAEMDKILGQQTEGRKTFANALLRKNQPMVMGDPTAQTVPAPSPPQAPPMPAPPQAPGPMQGAQPMPPEPPQAPQMPPRNEPMRGRMGSPPMQMSPQGSGTPEALAPGFIGALLAKLRNR